MILHAFLGMFASCLLQKLNFVCLNMRSPKCVSGLNDLHFYLECPLFSFRQAGDFSF